MDLDVFFEHMQDSESVWMAAFTPPDPTDRDAFDLHWNRLITDPGVTPRTIVHEGAVVGHVASFDMMGDREVTYWLGREAWGRGIATEAMRLFLDVERTRPLFGRAALDNVASTRVLSKCGFVHVGDARGFATARNEEIDEVVYRLDDTQGRDNS
jgi:RimJ/RimL family protein N-acetyltransferase